MKQVLLFFSLLVAAGTIDAAFGRRGMCSGFDPMLYARLQTKLEDVIVHGQQLRDIIIDVLRHGDAMPLDEQSPIAAAIGDCICLHGYTNSSDIIMYKLRIIHAVHRAFACAPSRYEVRFNNLMGVLFP